MDRFLLQSRRTFAELPFGRMSWLSGPSASDAKHLTVLEVELQPGGGHSFHRHPDQEELIYVLAGRIEQWLGAECRQLGPGDAIVIPRGAVHASFEAVGGGARTLAILGPCVGADGYACVDLWDQEPWSGLRPAVGVRSHSSQPATPLGAVGCA